MKNEWGILVLFSVFITGCGGSHPPATIPPIVYPPVPDTACGVATVAATALSADVRFIDPVNLSDAGGLSEHPSIATASGGKVYVAWDDDKNLNKEIYFKISDDFGSTYGASINVSHTGVASVPSLGVGGDGVIHVAWQDLTDGPAEIRYARSTDVGATFSSSVRVSTANTIAAPSSQESGVFLAVAPGASTEPGNIYMAWSETDLERLQFRLKVARSTDNGANFSIIHEYTPPDNATADTVSMTVDATGNLHMVWSELLRSMTATGRQIKYFKSTDAGVTFTPPILLAEGNTLFYPTITTYHDDPSNIQRVYIAWRNEDDTRIHFASSSNGGSTFSSDSVIVPNANLSLQLSPRLATGPDGTIYMAWTDNRTGNYETHYTKSTDQGLTFATPVNFSPSAQGSLFIAIAVDDESNIYIAWDDNRYVNPPDTPEEIGNEGNFEILVARGKQGLPAVQSASASPCPLTPNGDNDAEITTFSAQFSEILNWDLKVFAPDGSTVVFQQSGSGNSLDGITWDGTDTSLPVADGLYNYTVSGTNVNGVVSTAANGSLVLYKTDEDAAPAIVSFSREAFAFSPNEDGFKDSDGISAQFNKPVNWTIQIKDSGETVIRTLTGSGITLDSNVTRWNGKDDAGNLLPEGTYNVAITIMDGVGQSASCGLQPIPCLIMEIDTTEPEVVNPALNTYEYTSGDVLTISGTPSELALITIYVYNQTGVLARKVDREFREANQAFAVTWDGKDSNGQDVMQGTYLIYMWCRDRAGNTAIDYPYNLEFTVRNNTVP